MATMVFSDFNSMNEIATIESDVIPRKGGTVIIIDQSDEIFVGMVVGVGYTYFTNAETVVHVLVTGR